MGALSPEGLLVYAPLLLWYMNHGAVVTKGCYRSIDYQPAKIFPWFVEQVTEARRTGYMYKSKALLAEVFKLLGNSAYGKLIEALERQTNTITIKDEKVVDRALRSAYFSDLDEIGQAYELESGSLGSRSDGRFKLESLSIWQSCGYWNSITTFLTGILPEEILS